MSRICVIILIYQEKKGKTPMFGFFLVMPLVIIIAIGNILKRCGFYSDGDIAALSKTHYWVILPLLLFRTTYISGAELLAQPNLLIAVNVCYIATLVIAWCCSACFVHRGNMRRVAVSVMASFRSNNIYLGFPVIQLAMGEAGLHTASIYIAVSMAFYQILSLGGGEIALSGKLTLRGLTGILRKLAANPMMISCIAGIGAALASVPIHFVFDETMKLVSGAATAVALLALGGSLDIPKPGRVVDIIRRTWFDILIKLLINPLIMWGVLLVFHVPHELAQVTILLSSMPCAVNCFIVAKGMGMDGDYAADLVASTTFLGIVSIPAWSYALGIV